MESRDDDHLDRLLTVHFDRAAENQLGRAEAAFRHHTPAQVARAPWRLGYWLIGSSLAAAIALHRPVIAPPKSQSPPGVAITDSSLDTKDVECTYYWQTVDDGVLLAANDVPVRKLRRQQIQQVSWTDDDGKTQLQVSIPREQVIFVECPSY